MICETFYKPSPPTTFSHANIIECLFVNNFSLLDRVWKISVLKIKKYNLILHTKYDDLHLLCKVKIRYYCFLILTIELALHSKINLSRDRVVITISNGDILHPVRLIAR